MARYRTSEASRDLRFHRLLGWLGLAAAGVAAGIALGAVAVGDGIGGKAAEGIASYAGLSGNPDARSVDIVPPCLDCPGIHGPDSFGVGARLRAARDTRMEDDFRELGAVEIDYGYEPEVADDYDYGGRFAEPAPVVVAARSESAPASPPVAPVVEQTPETAVTPPPTDAPPGKLPADAPIAF
ncbi:MAG: hypothetical protein HEQ22_08605 [Sphingopyxis sp.]|uniref:hypothetical protein n=1 Tax=Sphingopyxis sp. TaxID=1908224 RepID=UPI003D80CBF5